jgi:DNA-binding ferritin-like protein
MSLDFSKRISSKALAATTPSLIDVAIIYRSAQLIAHNCHHLVKGATFFEDHEFLGELYGTYEGAYDSIIERIIPLAGTANLSDITARACAGAGGFNPEGKTSLEIFSAIMVIEQAICSVIKNAVPGATDGTQNLLQGLADESEVRQYKIGQRIK